MELVIVILFFSLSSAVCVQLFVKAHQLDQETIQLNHSVIWTQNLAESYRAYSGDIEKVASVYKEQILEPSDSVILYFDEDWNPITDKAHMIYAAFCVELSSTSQAVSSDNVALNESGYPHGSLKEAQITVSSLQGSTPVVLTSQDINYYVPSSLEKEASNE